MLHNPINASIITIYNIKHTTNTKTHFPKSNILKMFEHSKHFYYISNFYILYFIYFADFIYFAYFIYSVYFVYTVSYILFFIYCVLSIHSCHIYIYIAVQPP